MALMNSIMGAPMQFIQPQMPPALSANPEIAKAAMYGGGGTPTAAGGAVGGQSAPQGGQAAGSGILSSIMKLMGGSNGAGLDAIMSMLAGI